MFDIERARRVVSRTFSHDFSDIVLVPAEGDASSTKTRRGPGTIRCLADGALELKLFLTHEIPYEDAYSDLATVPGKLIPEAAYFRMEATDYDGATWVCERLNPRLSLHMASGSGTVTANLSRIEVAERRSIHIAEHEIHMVVPFKPDLGYHETVKQGTRVSLSRLEFTLPNDVAVSVTEQDDYIVLYACSNKPIDQFAVEGALQALAIASGQRLAWAYKFVIQEGHVSHSIAHIDREVRKLPALFAGIPMWQESRDFLERYVRLDRLVQTRYFGYWRSAVDAWQSGLSVAALPIAVYIEGIVADLFTDVKAESANTVSGFDKLIEYIKCSGKLDTAVIERFNVGDLLSESCEEDPRTNARVKKVLTHIKSATELDGAIIDRCLGSLARMKGGSVQRALRQLAGQGWFPGSLVKTWQYVRNKSAHGSDMTAEQEREQMQALADGVFCCLHLMYALLLIHMSFRGKFINYCEHGFPLVPLGGLPSCTSEKN